MRASVSCRWDPEIIRTSSRIAVVDAVGLVKVGRRQAYACADNDSLVGQRRRGWGTGWGPGVVCGDGLGTAALPREVSQSLAEEWPALFPLHLTSKRADVVFST